MTELKEVLIKDIHPDPNQPRRFYDEQAMDELTESIKDSGVIQPIVIRPNGKGYIIVCGERRYRAALSVNAAFKDRNTIPAVIRNLSDEEALQLQIVENLQRKDVHPMEEAVAFKSLLEKKQWSVNEIAHRVGKSVFYIRQRIKLNDLTTEWQHLFYKNAFPMTDALKISELSEKAQKEFYKNEVNADLEKKAHPRLDINNWVLNKFKGDLTKATFDLADTTLDKKAGACVSCQYNTACTLLFEDASQAPRCTNVSCFKHKSDIHFDREFKKAKEDPTIVLVALGYRSSSEHEKLKKEGLPLLKEHDDFIEITHISAPDPEDFDIDDYDSEEDMKKAFDQEYQDYLDSLAAFEKKISSAKYKKAFVVAGGENEKGKYTWIELKRKTPSKQAKGDKTSTDPSAADNGQDTQAEIEAINEEIDRLKTKEKRSKELDFIKVWDGLKTHFNPFGNSSLLKDEFTQVEREAIAMAIYNKIGYTNREHFLSAFKIKKLDFSKVDEVTLRQMTRFFFLDILPPTVIYNIENSDLQISMKIAQAYFPSVLKDLQDTQEAISTKRIARVNERIAALAKKKKELASNAKKMASNANKVAPEANSPAKKKASKK